MGDLKPIGSEKLTGQEKIKRIMEIARFKEVMPKAVNETAKSEYSIGLADGNNYQIVKERLGYIIKKTVSESETDYIEPMKNRKYYSSYSQAFKRLNLLAGELNRLNENNEGLSLYGEQKKFVLKTPKADVPALDEPMVPSEPPAVPSPSLPDSPTSDAGVEGEVSMDAEMGMDQPEGEVSMDTEVDTEVPVSGDGGGEMVSFKQVQKLTGKLTQKLRDLDSDKGLTSEEIKYVINMVLASVDLQNLSDEDKEDILSKFESDEMEDQDMSGEDMGSEEDITSDTEVEKVQSDMDVPVEGETEENYGTGAIFDSIFGESKIDKVISKYFEFTAEEKRKLQENDAKLKLKKISSFRSKLDSVKRLTESVEQEMASQKFLEENEDFKFVGKTNKKNLVFVKENKKVRISPEGIVL